LAGGALVVAANMIVHFNQGFTCGLSLNDFGDKHKADLPLGMQHVHELLATVSASHGWCSRGCVLCCIVSSAPSTIVTSVDAANLTVLDPQHILCAMKTGMLYIISLQTHMAGYGPKIVFVFRCGALCRRSAAI
jgi:hypothetical protein